MQERKGVKIGKDQEEGQNDGLWTVYKKTSRSKDWRWLMQKIGCCGGEGFAPVTLINQEKPVEEEEV